MRIAVNTRFLLKGKLEGIGWFTHEILIRMVKDHPEHEFIFFFDRPYDPSFVFASNVTPVVLFPPARHPLLWFIWFEIAVRRALHRYKPDLFISTDGFLCLGTSIPQLIVVHDLAFEHFPQHLPFKFRAYLRAFTPRFVRKATAVVTVSDYSRQDLVQTYHTPPEKISVVYNGAHSQYKPLDIKTRLEIREQYAGGCDYFLFAGALHPRKNVVGLLQAFALFKQKQRSTMKLLIIGRFAWHSDEIRRALDQHPFRADVVHYNYMQVEELSRVMGAAYALTFVSLFEGFGIPILEAMQCDVPAILSRTSSLPEVGGEAAIYAEATDAADMAQAMSRLYKDENLRRQLVEAGREQRKKFHWDKSAKAFYQVVEKIAAGPSDN